MKDLNSVLLAGEIVAVDERVNTDKYFRFTLRSELITLKVHTSNGNVIKEFISQNPVGDYVRVVGKLDAVLGNTPYINAEHVDIIKRGENK